MKTVARIGVVLSLLAGLSASAQTNFAWTNPASSGNWSTYAWSNSVPAQGGSNAYLLTFYAGTSTINATNDLTNATPAAFTLNGLTFANGAGTSNINLYGGMLLFTNNGALMPVVTNYSGASANFYDALILGTNTTFGIGNSMNVYGQISGSGGLTVAGSSGGGLLLTNANTYTGGTTNNGTEFLRMGGNNVFGTGPVVLNGSGSGISAAGITAETFTNALFINSNVVFGEGIAAGNLGNITNSGTVDLGGLMRTLTVSAYTNNATTSTNVSLVFNGTVQDGGLTKAGFGLLELGGTNTYAGGTLVNAGVLQFDSASALSGAAGSITNYGAVAFNFTGVQTALAYLNNVTTGSVALTATSIGEMLNFHTANLSNEFLGAATGVLTNNLANYIPYINTNAAYGAAASNKWQLGGGNGILVVTNAISGPDSVVIGGGGAGTVILAGSNSYTGATTIQNYQLLRDNSSNGLGNSSAIYLNGGTLAFSNAVVNSPIIINSGSSAPEQLLSLGGNVLQFEGSSTNIINGQITLIGSTLTRSGYGNGALNLIAGGVIGTNVTWDYYAGMSTALTITNKPVNLGAGGAIYTAGMIIDVGSNNVGTISPNYAGVGWGIQLGVNNAFTNAPTLLLGNSASVGGLDLHGYGLVVGTLTNSTYTPAGDWVTNSIGTTAILTVSNAVNDVFSGSLGGAALGLTKSGSGILTLAGTNTYQGPTAISNGTLIVSPVGGLSNNTAITVVNGALLLGSSNSVGSQSITVQAGGSIGTTYALDQNTLNWLQGLGNLTMNGAVGLATNSANNLNFAQNWYLGASGASNVTYSGAATWSSANMYLGGGSGTLLFTPVVGAGTNLYVGPSGGNPSSAVVLTGSNLLNGNIQVNSGMLKVTNDVNLGAAATAIVLAGGGLGATSNSVTLNSSRNFSLYGSGMLGADSNLTLSVPGVISDNGSYGPGTVLQSVGPGTVILSGSNTYSGGTVLMGGTLDISNDAALGASGTGLTFTNGGLLEISGVGTNSWTNNNRSITLAGNGGFSVDSNQTFTITNSITGAGTLMLQQNLGTNGGVVVLTASNSYTGGTFIYTTSNITYYNRNLSWLAVSNPNQLGAGGGITISNGGILRITGNNTYTNTLFFTGANDDGASGYGMGNLQNISGTNIWGGVITNATGAGAAIGVQAGQLTITNGITGSATMNLRTSGTLIINLMPITLGNNGLSITGAGSNAFNVAGNTFTTLNPGWGSGSSSFGVNNVMPSNATIIIGQANTDGTSYNFYFNGTTQTIAGFSMNDTNGLTSLMSLSGASLLTNNGNMTVGSSAMNNGTKVTWTGAGTLVVNTNNGIIQIGAETNQNVNGNSATNDMSGLGTFVANLGTTTGKILIGDQVTDSGSAGSSELLLATNSTITAGLIGVGEGAQHIAVQTLLLGAGTNLFNVNDVVVGSSSNFGRSTGVLQFNGATGSLSLSNATGGRADMYVVAGADNSGYAYSGTVNLTNHTSTLYMGNLFMAMNNSGNTATNAEGGRTATFSFNQGTLDVTNVVMATRNGNWSTTAPAFDLATLNIGGGTATIGQIVMATNLITGNAVTGLVNLTGGMITVSNGITRGLGGLATNGLAVVSLSGANTVLNMNGSPIGGAGTNFWVQLNATNGTLMNLAEYNGGATLVKAGPQSLLILSGTNTYTGGTVIQNGTLQFNSTNAMGNTSGGQNIINQGGAVAFNFAGISNVVVSRLAPISTGTLALTTNNAADVVNFYTANLTNLFLGADLGQTITNNAANFTPFVNTGSAGSNLWQVGGGGGTLVLTNAITGADSVVIGGGGGGIVVLAGTNTYTGGTILQYGGGTELSIGAYTNLPFGTLTFTGSTLQVTGTQITNLNPYTINWSAFTGGLDVANSANNLVVSNNLGGTVYLTKLGAGTLTLSGNNTFAGALTQQVGTLVLSGTNTFTASTVLAGGELSIGAYTNLPTTSPLIFAGGALQVTGTAITNLNPYTNINWGAFNGGVDVATATNTLTLTNVISGGSSFYKLGAGTLLFGSTVSNTYTGGTIISNGLLKLASNDTNALGSPTGSVLLTIAQTGAAFDIAGDTNLSTYSGSKYIVINGAGLNANTGAVFNSGTGSSVVLGMGLQLAGNASIGATSGGNRFDTPMINGGNGNTLTILGGTFVTYGWSNNLAAVNVNSNTFFLAQGVGPFQSNTVININSAAATFSTYAAVNNGLAMTNPIVFNAPGVFEIQGNNSSSNLTTNVWAGAITLSTNGTIYLNNNGGGAFENISGAISGPGLLSKTGPWTLDLSGANNNTGGILISAGALEFDSSAALGGSGANVTNNGGVVVFNYAGSSNTVGTRLSAASYGTLGLTANNQNDQINLYAAGLSNLFLGAAYVGNVLTQNLANITPYINTTVNGSNAWKFGGGGGTLVITNAITGSDSVMVGGTQAGTNGYSVVMLAGNSSYTGATIITNLQVLLISSNINALGNTAAINMWGGALMLSNATINAPIIDYISTTPTGYGVTSPNGWITPIGGTTNYVNGLVTVIGGGSIKSEGGSAAAGVTYFTGGILGTNVNMALYADAGNSGAFVITNNPINLGTGTLNGHTITFGVGSNTISSLSITYSGPVTVNVNNVFTNAPTLTLGSGTVTGDLDFFNLNGFNVMLGGITSTNSVAGLVGTNYITSTGGSAALTVSNATGNSDFYNGYFTQGVALVKSGAGTLILNNANNQYTNTTTVNGGILQINPVGSLTNSAITVNTGVLLLGATNTIGTNALTINGGGGLGPTNILDQTFLNWFATNQPNFTMNGAVVMSANDGNNLSFGGNLSNAFLGAAATTTLTYSSTATWADTTLRLGGGSGTLVYTPAIGAGSNLIVGPLNGNAASVVVLLASNSYTSSTLIQSGLLKITNDFSLGVAPTAFSNANITLNGGTLGATSNSVTLNLNRGIFLGTNGGGLAADSGDTLYVPNVITGGVLTVGGGTGGNVILYGANTYTGGTVVANGMLDITNDAVLGVAGNGVAGGQGSLTFSNGGVLEISGTFTNNNRAITLQPGSSSAYGVFDVDSGKTWTLTNAINGAGGMLLSGWGVVALTASNSYSGGTVVPTNTELVINNGAALGSGGVLITNGGVLAISGNITITNPVTIANGWGLGKNINYYGNLQSLSGTNVLTGVITSVGNSPSVGLSNGLLRISGGIVGAGIILTTGGNGGDTLEEDTTPINLPGQSVTFNGNGTNLLNVGGNVWGSSTMSYDGGVLLLGVNNALPTNSTLTLNGGSGDADSPTVMLNGMTQTVASVLVQSYTNLSQNTINVGTGELIISNGNLTVGANYDSNTVSAVTRLTVTGAGALIITNNGGLVQIGNDTGSTNAAPVGGNAATNDMSLLGTFVAALGTNGQFNIGSQNPNGPNNGIVNADSALVKLATNSTITAKWLNLGNGDTFINSTSTLLLGAGQNVLNVNTVFVGSATSGRQSGVLQFNGATGSLSLSNATGGRADMYIMGGYTYGTGGGLSGLVNLAGHNSALYLGNLYMGQDNLGNVSSNNIGARTATFTFDTGTLDVTNIMMATRNDAWSTNAAAYALATLNIGGGTSTIGQITLATNLLTGNSVTGIVNLTGGMVTITNGISRGLGGQSTNAPMLALVNLAGATLDLQGSAIGGAGSAFQVTLLASNGTLQNLGQLNGGAGLTKLGAGLLTLAGNNTYGGGTTISNGTVMLGSAGALPAGYALNVVNPTATLDLDGQQAWISTLSGGGIVTNSTGNGALVVSNGTFSGSIVGNSSLIKVGAGTTLTLSGTDTYTGGTTVSNGTLQLGSAGAFPSGTALNLVNPTATLDLDGHQASYGTLTGVGVVTNSAGGGSALVVSNGTYGGAISGASSLTMAGPGTLVLSGNNSFTGGTWINSGTLDLTGGSSLGSGNINVGSGATLDGTGLTSTFTVQGGQTLTNRGTVNGGLIIGNGGTAIGGGYYSGAVTNLAGGTLTPGFGGDTNTFNSLTLAGGSTNSFYIASVGTHDMSVVSNSLNYTGSGRPILTLNLTNYVQSANPSNGVIMLFQNYGTSVFDGTNNWLVLSDNGPNNGWNLYNGTSITIDGGTTNANTFTVWYNYQANGTAGGGDSIALTVIPEPASINLLVMLGAAYWMRRRIHRKRSRWQD